ncbi:MAG: histidinol-phosphatase HisJ [Lactobacillaceae bacterium]|jgi:histidinol-phosphatase (PHP family)|nr:histidinol-phosphatase HisJ [Lactobacillaceae bacterium]
MLKKDGHTHTQWSHHGSTEDLSKYIERAIELGFTEYVVTEHAPLPAQFLADFKGPVQSRDESAMRADELSAYKTAVEAVQAKYGAQITIKRGFEVDYLQAYEAETRQFLRDNADWIDEIVLSVHFLPNANGLLAPIDFAASALETYFADDLLTPQQLFARYFKAVQQSILFDTGLADKTVRIGHLTLIRKYQKKLNLPAFDATIQQMIDETLALIKARDYQVDFNSAGYRKEYNGEPYPTVPIIKQVQALGIPIVYGSDAHQVRDLGTYFTEMGEILEGNS